MSCCDHHAGWADAPSCDGQSAWDESCDATADRLTDFLERHAPMGEAGGWRACFCGWHHNVLTHAEHVAATMAAQRPWESTA